MLDERMLYDAASREEPVMSPFGGSSVRLETALGSALAELYRTLAQAARTEIKFSHRWILRPLLEVDSSTVLVRAPLITRNWDSLLESFVQETRVEVPVEYDVCVQLSPLEEYPMWVEIESVEQGVPRIVEPSEY